MDWSLTYGSKQTPGGSAVAISLRNTNKWFSVTLTQNEVYNIITFDLRD